MGYVEIPQMALQELNMFDPTMETWLAVFRRTSCIL